MKAKQRRLTKVVAIIVAAVMAAVCLGSCGGEKNANTTDEQGRTVISIGGWPQQEGSSLDRMNDLKSRFEASNEDAAISPDTWTFDLKSFYAKAAGGRLPTVYNAHFTEAEQIIDSGYAADLSAAMEKYGFNGKFSDKIENLIKKDGKIYAFPRGSYTMGLGYNVDLFEAAGLMNDDGTPQQPETWDDVIDFAVKIKQATGKPGFVLPTSNNNGGWLFTCLAWSFGAKFMEQDEDGKWHATFNSPETAQALEYVKDLKWKYNVLPDNTLIDGEEYYKTFATGGAGMLIAYGGFPARLTKYDMQPDQIGIMALPKGPKRHVTLLGGVIYSVAPNASEEQIDAAIRWLKMQYDFEATEDFKISKQNEIKTALDENRLVGIKDLSVWNDDVESLKFEEQLIDENANGNPNHVKLYNDFVKSDVEIQAEEPVCAQELYGILDDCIQEVLTNENADCAALLEKANSDFQKDYLDTLEY